MFSEPADANSGIESSLITISSPLNYSTIVANSSWPISYEKLQKFEEDKSEFFLDLKLTELMVKLIGLLNRNL